MTARELSLRMGERELGRWRKYAVQRGFASQRIQLQMATLCYMVAAAFGAADGLKISDFVVELSRKAKPETVSAPEDGAAIIGSLSGRGVRVLGQKRRRRKKE